MRVRNWDVALVQELGPLKGAEVSWGESDCVMLCIRGLKAMYPPDDVPLPHDLPNWNTKTGALRVLNREPAFSEVLREHGCEPVNLMVAQNGDIVTGLWPDGEMPGYGIVTEGGVLHVDADENQVVWDRLRDLRAGDYDGTILRPPHG